jgi:hypothetical protein
VPAVDAAVAALRDAPAQLKAVAGTPITLAMVCA